MIYVIVKKNHYTELTAKHANNPIKLWATINELLPSKVRQQQITNISSQSCNDYFTTIGANVVRSNVTLNYSYQWKLPESIYVFNFVPVNEATVYILLSTLSDQPRKDVIGMDCKLQKISAAIITAVINASLSKGFVMDDWKVAKVTPAYKGKGDVLDKTNYRPLFVVAHISSLRKNYTRTGNGLSWKSCFFN